MVTECNEAFGNKHSCRMANLEVFVFVPDLLLSRRFAPGQKRKSGTKTKTSKFAMRQLCLLPNASKKLEIDISIEAIVI